MANYRNTDMDRWGVGLGRRLTSIEADENIWEIMQALAGISEGSGSGGGSGIANVTLIGSQMVVTTTDGTEYAFTLSIPSVPRVGIVTLTTYTLNLDDAGRYLRCENASGCTITIPTDASVDIPVNTEYHFRRAAAGSVSFSPAVGVTLNGVTGYTSSIGAVGGVVTIKKIDDDEWDLFGLLTAS